MEKRMSHVLHKGFGLSNAFKNRKKKGIKQYEGTMG